MNDLSGLDWNAKPSVTLARGQSAGQQPPKSTSSPSYSGRSTPLSAQPSGSRPGAIQPTAKSFNSDSFSNLLAPKPAKPSGSLSLLERQKQLQSQGGSRPSSSLQQQDPYGVDDSHFWEGLGSGRSTPGPVEQSQKPTAASGSEDLLSAFSANAPTNPTSRAGFQQGTQNGSRVRSVSSRRDEVLSAADFSNVSTPPPHSGTLDDEDDPFELGKMAQSKPAAAPSTTIDDDDILGDLGKPISEVEARRRAESSQRPQKATPAAANPRDRALAELVDMGFAPERAQYALAQTDTGVDVQSAISVLLNEAHGTTNGESKGRPASQPRRSSNPRRPSATSREAKDDPPWLNGPRSRSRNNAGSPAGEEKELSQVATEIGTSMWKSANTLWKTGQKRMAKAVAEFQQEGDPNKPRWMQETQAEQTTPDPSRIKSRPPAEVTDEAAVLNSTRERPVTKQSQQRRSSDPRQRMPTNAQRDQRSSRMAEPGVARPQQRSQMGAAPEQAPRHVQRLTRQAAEDQMAQAYVSPARRKKQQQQQQQQQESVPQSRSKSPEKKPEDALDIFSSEPIPAAAKRPEASVKTPSRSSLPSRSRTQPSAPRKAPPIAAATLESSNRKRKEGTEAFKRGDYTAAHTNYTSALSILPSSHPITIILLSNRAITSLKSGDAKAALSDAETTLQTIGPSNGEGESISLGGTEGDKPMREYFGKALMRKAEALEHLEKWADAAKAWREAVQGGIGGAVAIQGRTRCEKASGSGDAKGGGSIPKVPSRPKPAPRATPKPSALSQLGGTDATEGEAVKRLRAAEAAAAAASDEAFALTDAVEARIANWRGGKADNLRALLGSLDIILWADAGWNKVGMSDLVLPQRVKIVYMKAIAKVHPDKISQNASTEQRMISATVFAALNEAWDKFKKDNGL